MSPGRPNYEKALTPYLLEWQKDLKAYIPELLRVSCGREELRTVIFIDNVDQLSAFYQAQVFLLAQRVARLVGSITIVALREESYYTASVQKAFTAYTSKKFHIASPHFRKLIDSRIEYAAKVLKHRSTNDLAATASNQRISDFFTIVQRSVFGQNRNIVRFIEALCYGNMRQALNMFTNFLTSGATDVDKMLTIYRRDGFYNVAFHEFAKSIILGDRKYYKEDQSVIYNVFNTGTAKNSSHFTSWRLIVMLLAVRSESSPEGRGFIDVTRLLDVFEDHFDNRQDLVSTLDRLVTRQLVEANTRSTETIHGASHVRSTPAGWYYVNYLVRSFAYLVSPNP
jgi:hypothetical protein